MDFRQEPDRVSPVMHVKGACVICATPDTYGTHETTIITGGGRARICQECLEKRKKDHGAG